MDANGIYTSTNGYCLFSSRFNGAQLYAIGIQQWPARSLPSSITFQHFANTRLAGSPGFTVWPATSFPGEHSTEAGGNRVPPEHDRRFPPLSDQRPGPTPLRDCINDTSLPTPFGPGCWQVFFDDEPAHDEVISTPDSLDGRMQQVWFVNGNLWGAAGTGVSVGGETKAGIAWFKVQPKINGAGKVEGKVLDEGYVWGDYGAAWTDGSDIWIASEYIGQACTLAQYYPGSSASPPSLAGFGSCGGTRVSLTNWFTRISELTPWEGRGAKVRAEGRPSAGPHRPPTSRRA